MVRYYLYYFESCPYCMRVLTILERLGIDVELRNIFHNPQYRRSLIVGGGKEQVPCLQIISPEAVEQWLYESDELIRFFQALK